jgi:hypothetical protein
MNRNFKNLFEELLSRKRVVRRSTREAGEATDTYFRRGGGGVEGAGEETEHHFVGRL